ncbi:MAG: VOC family protein [Isosphaeraceae bacterium]
MKPIQCLVETAVYADDLDRAERFYRETLGLTVKLITPGLWGLPATW